MLIIRRQNIWSSRLSTSSLSMCTWSHGSSWQPIWHVFRTLPESDHCFWPKLVLIVVGMERRRKLTALKWQIETIFEGGCAGAFVFAWTDEWHRGGYDIEDWDFGLTTRDRQAKASA